MGNEENLLGLFVAYLQRGGDSNMYCMRKTMARPLPTTLSPANGSQFSHKFFFFMSDAKEKINNGSRRKHR